MSSYILFLLLGLGAGAVYGMLALGLVLKYRSAGVVDFGHGAVAMFIAYFTLPTVILGSIPSAIVGCVVGLVEVRSKNKINTLAVIAIILNLLFLGHVAWMKFGPPPGRSGHERKAPQPKPAPPPGI